MVPTIPNPNQPKTDLKKSDFRMIVGPLYLILALIYPGQIFTRIQVNALPGWVFCSGSGGDDVTSGCESKNRFINSLFVSAFKWFGDDATSAFGCDARLFNAATDGDASAISWTNCCVVRTLLPTIFRIEAILWVKPSFASSFTRLALTLRRPEIRNYFFSKPEFGIHQA